MSKLFEKIDSDQNGSVTYNETKNWISELDRKKRREIAYDKFGEYDLDGDNIVSLNEYLERLNQERFFVKISYGPYDMANSKKHYFLKSFESQITKK